MLSPSRPASSSSSPSPSLLTHEQKLKKDIPGSPEGKPQIHDKKWTVYGAIQK